MSTPEMKSSQPDVATKVKTGRPKKLHVSKRAKVAVRRLRKDKRFFLYLCSLKPAAVIAPLLPWLAYPALMGAPGGNWMTRTTFVTKIITFVTLSLVASMQLIIEHSRYEKWLKKKPNQPPEPTSGTGTSAAEPPRVPVPPVAHL